MKAITLMTLAAIATASAANASLPRFDDNGNGTISVEEYLDAFGPEQGVEQFRHIDKNGNGMIDAVEYRAETNDSGLLAGK